MGMCIDETRNHALGRIDRGSWRAEVRADSLDLRAFYQDLPVLDGAGRTHRVDALRSDQNLRRLSIERNGVQDERDEYARDQDGPYRLHRRFS